MTDKTAFKKTLYRFNHEANILLRSNWDESPATFKRFLDRIEAEPDVKAYLDDCVDSHTPEDFNAEEDVREVAGALELPSSISALYPRKRAQKCISSSRK